MFGFSFGEIVVLLLVGIIVLGPRQLPTMLRTLGRWLTKLRRMAFDMRAQSGIDDILRDEGLDRDLQQLRAILRRPNVLDALAIDVDAEMARGKREVPKRAEGTVSAEDELVPDDKEYPAVGVDSFGAMPEDMDPYRGDPEAEAGERPAEETTASDDPEAGVEREETRTVRGATAGADAAGREGADGAPGASRADGDTRDG